MENEVPDFMLKALISIGGIVDTPNGRLPRFRIIRANKVMIWYEGRLIPRYWTKKKPKIVGYWVCRQNEAGDFENVIVPEDQIKPNEICLPKMDVEYIAPKYFVLEQWLHPGSYGPQWESIQMTHRGMETFDSLGDISNSDGYFHMANFQDPEGMPWELGQKMIDYVAEKWQQTLNDPLFKGWLPSEPTPDWALEAADKIDQEKQQKALAEKSRLRYETIMDIFQPAKKLLFHKKPNAGGGRLIVR